MTQPISYAAYQNQWFTTFQEQWTSLSFQCDKQCFVLLWALGSNEIVKIKWTTQWSGKIGRWFLLGQQIYPGDIVTAWWTVDLQSILYAHQLYRQIPKDQAQIVLLVDGVVKADAVNVEFGKMFFGEKLWAMRREFWTNEPLRPYSINLRYGIKLWWIPLIQIGYWLFGIGVCLIFLFGEKKKRFHTVFLFWMTLLLVLSLRNLLNWTDWTITWMKSYVSAEESQKTFFDLGDYPMFVKKMRETLDLDNQFGKISCTVFFDAVQEWPFKVHADTVYIKPCEPAKDKISADYVVFYKKPTDAAFSWKQKLLDWNGSSLFSNK
jgi:hypothetical protein